MAEQTRTHSSVSHSTDTSLDMLKRVLAVAELIVKSKQPPENKQKLAPESCEKTQSVRAGIS